jgi:GAF domain-containing protein
MAAVTLEHSERVRAEAEIRRRDEMLDGVAKAANRMFANAERDLSYQEGLLGALAELASRVLGAQPPEPGILAVIGTALRADCVATYEHAGPLPALRSIDPSSVWTNSDDPRDMTLESGSAIPSAWLTALNEGDAAGGVIERLPGQQKRAFVARGVRSTIFAPLVMRGGQVGLLEIDDDTADREWTRSEEHFVRACGLLLGTLVVNGSADPQT